MPGFDAASASRDEELHRAYYGHCLGPCDHPECREALAPSDHDEHGDPIA